MLYLQIYSFILHFNYINIINLEKILEDGTLLTSSLPFIMKVNAAIILGLVDNAEIVNLHILSNDIEGKSVITYKRKDLVDYYGENLEQIVEDKSALERFIKTN
ncbi:hypothetical protein ABFP60_05535 [Clostridioides difficile]